MLWSILIFQLIVPLLLLLAQLWSLSRGRWEFIGLSWLSGAYLLAVSISGLWLLPPITVLLLYWLLWAISLYRGWRRQARPQGRVWLALLTNAAALGMTLFAGYLLNGWRTPAQVVDLEFPLNDGIYYVANGGGNEWINSHWRTLQPELKRFRGQSKAVDIIEINPWGLRADGILPAQPERYEIFGDQVFAPCAGQVLALENSLPDLAPPQVDREHLPGNYVLLGCDRWTVLLAHLQQGSVQVARGDSVQTGQLLGTVGNSGNSNEPHLHIHVQTHEGEGRLLDAEPVALRLDGRYLVRNSILIRR